MLAYSAQMLGGYAEQVSFQPMRFSPGQNCITAFQRIHDFPADSRLFGGFAAFHRIRSLPEDMTLAHDPCT